MVEAIESLFVPVVIYNNRPGRDAEILKQFGEPSWNYQVIRFLNSSGEDIIPRKDRVWTLEGVASRMIDVLRKQNLEVPNYLKSLVGTNSLPNGGRAAFEMYCFWTGELRLGAVEGVLATEAGWIGSREVTLVEFDRDQLDFATLVKKAESFDCARRIYTSTVEDRTVVEKSRLNSGSLDQGYRPASARDQKRQIQGSRYLTLGLSPVQATKVNAFARTDPKRALSWLSPRQINELGRKS